MVTEVILHFSVNYPSYHSMNHFTDIKYVRCSSVIMEKIVYTSPDQGHCNMSPIKYRTFQYILKWIKHHIDTCGRDLTTPDEVPSDEYEKALFAEVNSKHMLFEMANSASRLNIKPLYHSCCKAIVKQYPWNRNKVTLIFRRSLRFVDAKYLKCSTVIMDNIVAQNQYEMHPIRFATFSFIFKWLRHHVDAHGRDLTTLAEVPFDEFERSHLLEANSNGKLFDVAMSANWLNITPLYKSCCKAIPLAYPGHTEEQCLQGLVVRDPDTN